LERGKERGEGAGEKSNKFKSKYFILKIDE
jgi:hypothetical protein